MIAAERLERIAALIQERRTVSISELSDLLDVSEATIRRDLTKLEKHGLLKRTYGGALSSVSPKPSSLDEPYDVRALYHVAEKRAIAQAAAGLISDGETIVIDAGTTTALLAHALRHRHNLTVITNSQRVMNELYGAEGVTVIVTGGELFVTGVLPVRGDVVMVGPIAEETLRRFRPARAFLGTAGITIADGMSNSNLPQAQIKQLMSALSDEVILLTDHTKFGHLSYSIVDPISVLDRVITDSGLAPCDHDALAAQGVEVVIVDPLEEPIPGV